MSKMRFPGYKAIVPNEIYGRDTEPVECHPIGVVPATQVMRLGRFRVPTQDEVIDFIRVSAREIDTYSQGKDSSSEYSDIIYSLKLLPFSEVQDIASGDDDVLKHLRKHYPKSDLQEGRFYLGSSNGTLPNRFLRCVKDLASDIGTKAYDRAIERTAAKVWSMVIRLSEDGKFPNFMELEYLMERRVKDCDVFSVGGNFGEYQVVVNQISMLNNVLGSKGLISKINDTSPSFLEKKAVSIIQVMAQCIAMKNVSGGLAGLIGEAFGGIEGLQNGQDSDDDELDEGGLDWLDQHKDEQQWPDNPGYSGGCSLN